AGTVLRFLLSAAIKTNFLPATLFINLAGSFLIGMIMGSVWKNESWKLILGAGFCGGFTTFSAFSMENVLLFEKGKIFLAALYIMTSVAGGIFSAWLGYKLIHK
ncbi:MAG: CrcB family protein, partial [Chitinophagaceae bacterium]